MWCTRVHSSHSENPLRHPAVGAALAARNAVAAEMAVAGRAGHDPRSAAWWLAAEDLAREVNPDAPAVPRLAGAAALALPLCALEDVVSTPPPRKPAARRRRELLELVAWFGIGGVGGLAALAAVRLLEQLLRHGFG